MMKGTIHQEEKTEEGAIWEIPIYLFIYLFFLSF